MSSSHFHLGSEVLVTLREIVCPDLRELRQHVGPDFHMIGKVTCFSDSGSKNRQYAVLSVEGLAHPLIAPVSRLRELSQTKTGTMQSL